MQLILRTGIDHTGCQLDDGSKERYQLLGLFFASAGQRCAQVADGSDKLGHT